MENPLRSYRLERLFFKRKSANSSQSADPRKPQPIFPQPSFISPKSSRMIARDEVGSRTPSPRKQSLSDGPSSLAMSFSEAAGLLGGASSRAGSLLERSEVTTPELQVLRHSSHLSQPNEVFSASSSHPILAPEHPASLNHEARPKATMPHLQRLDTPPASDPEDSFSLDLKSTSVQPNALSHTGLPTPGPSPDMPPVSDSSLAGHPETIGVLDTNNVIGIAQGGSSREVTPVTRSFESQLSTVGDADDASQSGVLKEPTLDDFLHLSDDDIAEEQAGNKDGMRPQDRPLPPTPLSLVSRSRAASALTLPSPFYSRPATAAAFEAARIAARHNFDLIYVVNLWPEKGNSRDPRSTPTKWSCQAPKKNKSRMRGRFLAAYGLSTVKSPFRISTKVHRRILRSDGWIEYRNDEPKSDDFARGYACAFYRGQYGGTNAPSGPTTAAKSGGENIDRGIVFAAYRKPSKDGERRDINCSQEQLSTIYRDAETLVEILIDIHMANRLRNPTGQLPYSDETGPMPMYNPMKRW